jgi:hypothetical protein
MWAWPEASPSLCPNGVAVATPPRASRNVRLQWSTGGTPIELPLPLELEMTPDHAYTYSIVGAGTPGIFVVPDAHPLDRRFNYGEYHITITPM